MLCRLYRLLVCNMIKAIKNLIPMRDTQAKRRVPNSPAIPLPSVSFGRQIPLPEASANDTQANDSAQVLTSDRAHFGDQSAFCPCCQGGCRVGRGVSPAVLAAPRPGR